MSTNISMLSEKYKEYKSGVITLEEFLSIYKIPVDSDRISDYELKNVDDYSIEVFDKSTNTSFSSQFTGSIPLFDYISDIINYINLIIKSPTYQIDRAYSIETNLPVKERLTFINGDYSLNFTKEYSNNVIAWSPLNGKQISVNYSKKKISDDNNSVNWVRLFDRDYRERYDEANGYLGYYQSLFADGGYLIDKYTYYNDDNVVYTVYNYDDYDSFGITGVCLEKCGVEIGNRCPDHIKRNKKLFESLKDGTNNKSAMVFDGLLNDGKSGCYHKIAIFKKDSSAYVSYSVEDEEPVEFSIPLLNDDSITHDELQIINGALLDRFSDNLFINLIIAEFDAFGKKIDIRKGLIDEEIDRLSPIQFRGVPLEEIASMVDDDSDSYFDYCDRYFKDISSNGDVKEYKMVDNKG